MLDYLFEDTIDAPIEIVFDLISDLPNYKQWNPFVTADLINKVAPEAAHALQHKAYRQLFDTRPTISPPFR